MSAHFLRPQAYRLALLALGISLLFVALRPTPTFDYDFEGFFPRGDESLLYYQDFRERFQNDNDYLLIAVQAPETVWDREFLGEVEALQEALRELPAVLSVQSALDLEELRAGAFGLRRSKYIQFEDEEELAASQKRVEALQTTGLNLSPKRSATSYCSWKTNKISPKNGATRFTSPSKRPSTSALLPSQTSKLPVKSRRKGLLYPYCKQNLPFFWA
ncbi:hypothetical protein [Nitritalea halalkaliphila]|uniref:hypothetical protein n=1 Tax=Nitritalea halalkaliphila TaxID=590849 RepID=UPI0002F17012|nr:hypothetical protein [Nitritalea halalkaliphila]